MPPNHREPYGWAGELSSGLLEALSGESIEVTCYVARAIAHGLFFAFRVLFHLLTCHF